MLFIHGWPDNSTLWNKQISYFNKLYRCINLTLPNFDHQDEKNLSWGNEFH
jgi:pimeloyl-ACP methyl ester carboxylesterase